MNCLFTSISHIKIKQEDAWDKAYCSGREAVCRAGKEGIQRMEANLSNSRVKDSSAKMIFGDATLCAQFLRGYVDIPMLKDVQPEDIEDVTERYVHMFTEERNSDIVKKIRVHDGIQNENEEVPFYLISLIEHKSKVDYNVVMQVIRYMVFIWEDYEKEMERQQAGISRTRDFRYPPVIPIVFYDGEESFTAATQLHDRIRLSDVFGEYIPDYKCLLVQLRDFSNVQMMINKDIFSLLMLIDKLQNMEEFAELSKELSAEYLEEMTAGVPEYLLNIIAQIMEILLAKLNVPYEEAAAFTEQIRERRMGELLANFKGYDIQEARKKASIEGREEGRAEGREEGRAEGREEGRAEGREEGIRKLIAFGKKHEIPKEDIQKELVEQYCFEDQEAMKRIEECWQE